MSTITLGKILHLLSGYVNGVEVCQYGLMV